MPNALTSSQDFERFIYNLPERFPSIKNSTLVYISSGSKHISPNIKRHRVPAPDISFTRPNLPYLIEEIERELLNE